MITIISGTNRPDSNSSKIAAAYAGLLEDRNVPCQVLDLRDLPDNFISHEMYGKRSEAFDAVVNQSLATADRFVFIVPEYNGGFPGILKTFIDAVDTKLWRGKKGALVGLSAGRAGAIVGMSHLTDILHYLGMEVYSDKVKLSQIESLLGKDGKISNEESMQWLNRHTDAFLKF